jgi:hypothetical protein
MIKYVLTFILILNVVSISAQQQPISVVLPATGQKVTLHSGWMLKQLIYPSPDGNTLTTLPFKSGGWLPATVPGTILTSLVKNELFPDPDFGMNNELIPDIYETGKDFYSCWYINRFILSKPETGQRVWLNFRGINYKADLFLNGHRVNEEPLEGMFLRRSFDISTFLKKDSINTLAVLVLPPDQVGKPNGGQGGDGMIARNNTMQFTAGWDWIQPVRDRNTGIWDEVTLSTTGAVKLNDPYFVTSVPGKRIPGEKQADAFIKASTELENLADQPIKGLLACTFEGREFKQSVEIKAHSKLSVTLPDITIKQPHLWWPNGMGNPELYPIRLEFRLANGSVSDKKEEHIGIREITSTIDSITKGRVFSINGQKLFIRGGNWIASDWLLRLSAERYATEVRFHHDMNLNMIRVWGGGLTERPEFYKACDENGMLVMQDLWISGDCNGAWPDQMKKESQLRRSEYPDNHLLFKTSAIDQIKMLRNHPSLCFWTGGNEWAPAKDILDALKNNILPTYDPQRLFISCSTSPELTFNLLNDNGDGPYSIFEPEWFYTFRSHPFNPELGSVGLPEAQTFHDIFEEKDLQASHEPGRNKVLQYHKFTGYGDQTERYGAYKTFDEYLLRAQLINYQQYQSFMEGWTSHMWKWYTGILIWKTQNPWTALRGQMYDHGLDQNACFYGLRSACEPIHIFWNRADNNIGVYNTTPLRMRGLKVISTICKLDGTLIKTGEMITDCEPQSVNKTFDLTVPTNIGEVYFLKLQLNDAEGKQISSSFYWISSTGKDFKALSTLEKATVKSVVSKTEKLLTLSLVNEGKVPAFFIRIHVIDSATQKRILPIHYSDNYISLLPGEKRSINIELPSNVDPEQIKIRLHGWNLDQ